LKLQKSFQQFVEIENNRTSVCQSGGPDVIYCTRPVHTANAIATPVQ